MTPRLLLVEDEASLALTLSDRLRAEGYEVEVCGNGESALELLKERPLDLVILDLTMPGISGIESGTFVTQYRWRLNGGAWSTPIDITTPITLTSLAVAVL